MSIHKNKVFRETFGIKGYKDIISAFLVTEWITSMNFDNGYLFKDNKEWTLQADNRVKRELGLYGCANVIVSYQHRTTGFYAIARLYKKEGK